MATASSANNATVRSRYFHPQHMLAPYSYSDASTYPCAACELVVTGAGYSCDECDFNIHKACFTELRSSISLGQQQELTFTRVGASRECRLCQETSDAGRYMYRCDSAPAYYVHPRCVLTSSTCFHPQHLLTLYNYEHEASATHPCAACGRRVTGIEYRCGECDFHIHKHCLGFFSGSISFPEHRRHRLTLTCCLTDGSHRCDLCKETSRAGFYMYFCEPCNYSLHPQCMVDNISRQPPPARAPPQQPNRGGAHRAVETGLHVVHTGLHVAHTAHNAHNAANAVTALASAARCAIM